MKKRNRLVLLLSLATLISGCKLALIVVEGGEVWSEDSGTCGYEDKICIVDVSDPTFSENFIAVPNDGYYFEKWNSGDRFFCGGSTNRTCALSFEGYEESEAVQAMVASSETFYLMPIFKPQSHQSTVEVNGKEWLQPLDVGSYTSAQVRAVCPAGVCIGNLPESDMNLTGYRWASVEEVIELFNAYGVEPPFTGPNQTRENQSAAAEFFNDFRYSTDINTRLLITFARARDSEDSVYGIFVGEEFSTGFLDFDITSKGLDEMNPVLNTWFWKPTE
jgi:hypothetical protein